MEEGQASDHAPQLHRKQKKRAHCKFYANKNGCRSGDACPFVHDPSRRPITSKTSRVAIDGQQQHVEGQPAAEIQGENPPSPLQRSDRTRDQVVNVPVTKVVKKPIPAGQANDPRAFQISQLKRRFPPVGSVESSGTTILTFSLQPSDPDFPFELPKGLECALHIPKDYAALQNGGDKPFLEVRNETMGEQWRRNIETGFGRLVAGMGPSGSLLGSMNRLDKDLESLLTVKNPEVVTIVSNRSKKPLSEPQEAAKSMKSSQLEQEARNTPPTYTMGQLKNATRKRESDIRQLEARLGRLPGFSKSLDGIRFTIPVTLRKPQELPRPLQNVDKILLYVPILYPLQPCRMEFPALSAEQAVSNVENAFTKRAKSEQETLLSQINMLTQDIHILARDPPEKDIKELPPILITDCVNVAADHGKSVTAPEADDRPHVKLIPKPPEWVVNNDNEEGSDSSSEQYDSDAESGPENGTDTLSTAQASTHINPERGISLSFPLLELYSIELLEVVSLSVTVRCLRCKDPLDVAGLRNESIRAESCKKCASPFSIRFRREFVHANASRAGYLDLEGCTVLDLLPSAFLPTCSQCSTIHPAPGVVSVRGASTMAICRECHAKMSFKIPEVKFLLVSSATRAAGGAPVRKKRKENLGITVGEELPRRGRCHHYSKSYRWFRFSCCGRVFPCDRCHDEETDHPNEHANRMLCGFCSREQNYRPEDCGFCRASVIKKVGSGFWEGGKGTRDKTKMSRKDPRKYKRRPGGAARKA